ncbi:MAG: alpha-glucan phosphorylase [Hydrogenophilales bacterium 28-61-23]|nr:MAG: alpha-glucan phosphorylase [Hydrogenophilales bacterium 28-61-23]
MPNTISVEIRPVLPESLKRLEELAGDLYFTFENEVQRLFGFLDAHCWEACGHNPQIFLRRIAQRKLDAAAHDPVLLTEYRQVLSSYDTYLEQTASEEVRKYLHPKCDLVAYFSAEYGFHTSIPIYAGGLGILSGDYLKSMSNLHVPFVGVGMLYHQGYFSQRILPGGEQRADYPYIDAADLPVTPTLGADGQEIRVQVELPGRTVWLRVWQAHAGHLKLYLLDSDLPENNAADRKITYHLYDSDTDIRIQQEIVFGIGGTRALRALGHAPTVWHLNEGHAAFLILERCLEYVAAGLDTETALERVAANTVFTTHTPVPAGHDVFHHPLMRAYFHDLIGKLGMSEERFLALGNSPHTPQGFNMTCLALRGSRFHNGVSRIHGRVASEMEAHLWPQIPPEENPLGYVTNGVHVNSMLGPSWVALLDMYMGHGWRTKLTDKAFWHGFIERIPDHVYLSTRQILKVQMLEDVRQRLTLLYRRNGLSESVITHLTRLLNNTSLNTLVVGFARRFATYKRAGLLFHDLPRLARLVNDPERPIVFLFAGKAHPADLPGQDLIRQIYEIGMRPEFQGKVLMLEDYSLAMARKLLPGVDVWLNNPEYPLEACGTSGMKAAINGGINLSVLDGWWAEAYDGDNGWAITHHLELSSHARDAQEASELLTLLEEQVVPLFYARNADGEPEAWVKKSKASMKTILPRFNSLRMSMDYLRELYAPAIRHCDGLSLNGGSGASELSAWKKCVAAAWPGVSLRLASEPPAAIQTGDPLTLQVAAWLNGLDASDVVVECLAGRENDVDGFVAATSITLEPKGPGADGETLFAVNLQGHKELPLEGFRQFRVRIYPFHPLQAHRFECGCMVWL